MQTITLLDGGLAQEIYRRSQRPAHPLWSTQVMREQPHHVQAVHEAFIAAGARIITLNTYTATPTRLARDGEPDWFESLHRTAIDLARRAISASGEAVQIAGCLPPLIGSYSVDTRSEEELLNEYRRIVAAEQDAVELFIAETQSSSKEARAAIAAATEAGKPVLLSFTLSDDGSNTLRSGEPIAEAIATLDPDNYQALLFNCSLPETISAAMPLARTAGKPFGGYANGFASIDPLKPGGTVDALHARTDLNERRYTEFVMEWIGEGATVVGGCCEVSPAHIAHLSRALIAGGFRPAGWPNG